jgi:hydroxymethylpyrimidine kinase/phosphomethylpyrimidine kinase
MAANPEVPVALTIAGSDSSGGAGIQADLKTFSALGVYGLTAITGIVAERPGLVSKIEAANAEVICVQMEVLLKSFPVAAIKTGLLFSGEIVSEVARTLRARTAKGNAATRLIVDPVMVATSGDLLLRDDAVEAYERELFPLAALVTPNLDEAARLLGEPISDLQAMRVAGARLMEKYRIPVLLKGGHLSGSDCDRPSLCWRKRRWNCRRPSPRDSHPRNGVRLPRDHRRHREPVSHSKEHCGAQKFVTATIAAAILIGNGIRPRHFTPESLA